MGQIRTIIPVCLGDGGDAIVHSLLLYDETDTLVKAYASPRFLERRADDIITAQLLLADFGADQEGALQVIAQARAEVDMIELEPFRVKSWGVDAAIKQAWRAKEQEPGNG